MRTLRTKFDNSRCRVCHTNIPYGTNVRHTGGYGVTCMTCPHEPGTPPNGTANGTTNGTISAAVLAQLVIERDGLRTEVEALRRLASDLAGEISALKADRRVGPLAQLPIEVVTLLAEDDCPI
jgi:hypothetical protein